MASAPSAPPNNPLSGQSGYQFVKALGTGAFGSVLLYRRQLTEGGPIEEVAVKVISREECSDFNLVSREVHSHRILVHPHVIRFKRLGLTPDKRFLYMVMEYADRGDLLDYLRRRGRFREHEARWFFQQLVFGLDYCHQRGVVNRDLKPENLLLKRTPDARQELTQGDLEHPFNLHLKIADFGLSKEGMHSQPKSRVGTVTYMAPEVLRAGPSRRYDGNKADIWSAGIVLYVMLFARAPFDDPLATTDKARRDATMQQILRGEWNVPASVPVAPECLDLLRGILSPDPNTRFTLAQIMSHPWFSVGLPPAALTMNTVLVRQQTAQPPPYEQSVEDVNTVLEEATQRPGHGQGGGLGGSEITDSGFMTMIADEMEEENRRHNAPYMVDPYPGQGQPGAGRPGQPAAPQQR
ncbi:hypothetical protein CHLRE_02g075900v5 [Chlamydomonas reinhardtii]|uniref:Uncharacterized protein n=1 Tax=Chlamydomonas reinhardtii TaxID=3055 RepID=A8IA26_CHLRE|nr:uncharacterized protein CHLRE_02g075900v5 [Chlamydomonas reinhardtii]PNW86177.1 hypothetical protein CHLRE_02g075900v5 [Chlamydomonas reinhardtii]|eukprot:XP_001701841.1 serine/threonine protein kinase 9 [Chlamydomonas reinhardtii]